MGSLPGDNEHGIDSHRRRRYRLDLRAGSVRAASLAVEMFSQAHRHLLFALDPFPPGAEANDEVRSKPLYDHDAMNAKTDLDCRRLALQHFASATSAVRVIVADDAPERAILVAAELSADCALVGHYGEGLAPNTALGSMPEHVVHAAISDVMVVI